MGRLLGEGGGGKRYDGLLYNLDYSRARAYFARSRCGWGLVWTFFLSSIISLFFSLSLGDGPI